MTYQGSTAFSPYGTKVFVEGIALPEVRGVGFTPGKETRIVLNWLPLDEAQNFLIELFLRQEIVGVEVMLPASLGERAVKARISDLNITLPAGSVATMFVVFKTYDPADDGPEVETIMREGDIAFEPIAKLLREYWAKEPPVSGHSYHYTPDVPPRTTR